MMDNKEMDSWIFKFAVILDKFHICPCIHVYLCVFALFSTEDPFLSSDFQ